MGQVVSEEELAAITKEEGDQIDYDIVVQEESLGKSKCNFAAIKGG